MADAFPTIIMADARPGRFLPLARQFRRSGCRVFLVTSGREMVATLLRWRAHVCAVHHRLAEGDGFAFLPIIQDLAPQIHLIAISDTADPGVEADARAAGVVLFSVEPVDDSTISAAIDSALHSDLPLVSF